MKHNPVVLEEQFRKAVNFIKDDNIRKFTFLALTQYIPLSFWEIPAAFAAGCHNESEKTIGEIVENGDEYTVINLGGKAWHTLRVLNIAKSIVESDEVPIWDYMKRNIKGEFHGNELNSLYTDICYSACLLHDVFSLMEDLEWRDTKHRGMDKNHPYYHRTELCDLAKNYMSPKVWEFFLIVVESHMWKWSVNPDTIPRRNAMLALKTVKDAFDFSEMYRVIEIVHIADLIASNKEFNGF